MQTIQDVAKEIEQLKPDFTEFLKVLDSNNKPTILKDINETANLAVKLLKAEVTLLFKETHAKRNSWDVCVELGNILTQNLTNSAINMSSSYISSNGYNIANKFNPEKHIMAHIQDPKPYLPKYLWDKVRTKKTLATTPPKQLQPNNLSLEVFRNYVNTLKKPMTAAVIMNYLHQLKGNDFTDFRQPYMDIIFTHTPSPSIEVQKLLAGGYNGNFTISPLTSQENSNTTVEKYMYLNRHQIRNMAINNHIPVSYHIYDTLDSSYKPFITGLKRSPEKSDAELSYLFDALITLQVCSNKESNLVYDYFIEELTKFLSYPEHKTAVDSLKENLHQVANVLPNLKF